MSIHISSLLVWDHSSGLLLQVNVWVPWLYLGHWVNHNWAKIGSIELKNPASLILEKGRKFTTFTLDQNPPFLRRARNPCPFAGKHLLRQTRWLLLGRTMNLFVSSLSSSTTAQSPAVTSKITGNPAYTLHHISRTQIFFCHYGRNSYNVIVLLLILEAHKVCVREAEDLRKK